MTVVNKNDSPEIYGYFSLAQKERIDLSGILGGLDLESLGTDQINITKTTAGAKEDLNEKELEEVVEEVKNLTKEENKNDHLTHNAISANDIEGLQTLINCGLDINKVDVDGNTLLHTATKDGRLEICNFLINKGIDVSVLNNDGRTALGLANDLDEGTFFGIKTQIIDLISSKMEEVYVEFEKTVKDPRDSSKELSNQELLASFKVLSERLSENNFDGRRYEINENSAGALKLEFGIDSTKKEVPDDESGQLRYVLHYLAKNWIFEAAKKDDVDSVNLCLALGVSKSIKDEEGKSFLYYAKDLDAFGHLFQIPDDQHFLDGQVQEVCRGLFEVNVDPESKKIEQPESGQYQIIKDEDRFKIFRNDEQINEDGHQLFAIREIAKIEIFKAVGNSNEDLVKSLIEVIDKSEIKNLRDDKGWGLQHYVNKQTSKEIRDLIKKDELQDLFRDLASKVRNIYINRNSDESAEEEIQKEVNSFGSSNQIDLSGLTAYDMISLMKDISIVDDGVKNLDREIISDNSKILLNRKIKNDEEENPLIKPFYRRLLLTCLEGDHRFISEEHNDSIKDALFEQGLLKLEENFELDNDSESYVSDDEGFSLNQPMHQLGSNSNIGFLNNSPEVLRSNSNIGFSQVDLNIDDGNSPEVFGSNSEIDITINSDYYQNKFKSISKKFLEQNNPESVLDLYKQSCFEEIKVKEGYPDNIDYEIFSSALAKLSAAAIINKIKELEDFVTRIENSAPSDEKQQQIENAYSSIKEYSEDPKKVFEITFDILAGKETRVLETLAKIIKDDEKDYHKISISLEDEEKADVLLQESAGIIQRNFRGFFSRKDTFSLSEYRQSEEILGEFLREKIDEHVDNEGRLLNKNDLANYSNAISEVVGDACYENGYGLLIHDFNNGLKGLHKFNDQIELSNSRTLQSQEAKFAIARINNIGPDKQIIHAVATSNTLGTNTTFTSEDISSEIQLRSEEIFKNSLDYVTTRDGLKMALASLILARGQKQSKDDSEQRKELSEEIRTLRKCLSEIEINENDLSKEGDNQKTLEEKARNFEKKISSFHDVLAKHGLLKDDKFDTEKLFALIDDSADREELLKREETKEHLTKLFSGESTENQRKEAKNYSSKRIGHEMSSRIKEVERDNKFKFDLDGLEKAELFSQYKYNSNKTNYVLPEFALKNQKEDVNKLLAVDMPNSPYAGISIARPRGYGNKTVAVTFNIKDDNFDIDTAFVALKIKGKPYHVAVTICQGGETYDGKEYKKGEIMIRNDVISERLPDGEYKELKINKLPQEDKKEVEEALANLKIKAVSIIDGKRCGAAILCNGFSAKVELQEKASYLQNIEKGERFKNEGEKINNDDVVFKCDEDGAILISQPKEISIKVNDKFAINYKRPKSTVNSTNKDPEASLKSLKEEEKKYLVEEFKEHFGDKIANDLSDALLNQNYQEALSIISKKAPESQLSELNKKFSVIHKEDEFKVVIPIDPTQHSHKKGFEKNIKFSSPELEIKEGETVKKLEIFDSTSATGFSKEVDDLLSSEKLNFQKVLKKVLSESELVDFWRKGGISDEKQRQDFCAKFKNHCEKTRVYVGFQQAEKDGTKDGEDQYKNVQPVEAYLFDVEKGRIPPSGSFELKGSENIREVSNRLGRVLSVAGEALVHGIAAGGMSL